MTSYDTDVYAWSQEQEALLVGRQWNALDIANLIEEILSVSVRQYTAVSSAVYQILVHLLRGHQRYPGLTCTAGAPAPGR